MENIITKILGKSIKEADNKEVYIALLKYLKKLSAEKKTIKQKRKLYYFSSEFLIGKLLSNNLINLHIYDEVNAILQANGKSLAEIEACEPEPSLGNGGLGRLAACFLDSIANLNLNGDGVGLNYHFGLFKQVFNNHMQNEEPNSWIEDESILTPTDFTCKVEFNGFSVKAKMYDIDIFGSEDIANKLHLFDVTTLDESIVHDGITFDKTDIAKNLTLFLYPDDSDRNGHLLRIYQQYFMVSCGARLILKEMEDKGQDFREISKYVAIQINDTHPSMIIHEMIRLLVEKGMTMKDATEQVAKTCAYTNHTILAEALEKWPLDYLKEVVPALVDIIKYLDKKAFEKYPKSNLKIIDENNLVHMARMDMHYGYSVNGVAYLHTEILKNNELKPFYDIYPEKFNNKTNGITFRRWLKHCNKPLSAWIDEKLGENANHIYSTKPEMLEELLALADNEDAQNQVLEIKMKNKLALKEYIAKELNITIDEHSIFDIQIKRLHEYKRQQMNLLYLIHKYLEIKSGKYPTTPITAIFGAKAAPAYTIAKDIIHAILCLQQAILDDEEAHKHLKVIMVENYNVSAAEKLIPACDVSEQISLASKEASGTGNMKFMLNGAITLGTMDGANVEIADLVGEDNIYVFGKSSDEIIKLYDESSYSSKNIYINDEQIRTLVNFIVGPQMLKLGNVDMLLRLHAELIRKDWFMTLIDLNEYIQVKEKCFADYENRNEWAKKMIVNIAKTGFFSSDRTIKQYNEDIWKL